MKEKINQNLQQSENNLNSVKEYIFIVREWAGYFWSKKWLILSFCVFFASLGILYSWMKKTKYVATSSFVLESGGRGGGINAYAGIASSLGIDMGGTGGGLFEGDNIIELYKSKRMISKALLSEAVFSGKKQLLIERYIEFNPLGEKNREESPPIRIGFRADNKYKTSKEQLVHDSIMSQIVGRILKGSLEVEKRDKSSSIIYVTVISPDELFAKLFNEKLVSEVNQFYLDTKIKKSIENVSILQAKSDSVRGVLYGSINRGAAVLDATPNQNPTRMAQRIVPIQNSKVSAEISQATLGALLQNLETSKIAVLKESPLIQIVDYPILPLEKKTSSKLIALLLGGFVGVFLVLAYLSIKKVLIDALRR